MILRPTLLVLLVALAAPLASATVGPDALRAESLSIDDVTITEGDVGAATATFTVTLSAISPDTVTVDYATADGTAVAPGDYSAAGGTITFLPGETTRTVSVDVNGDALDEEDEAYTVDLTNAVNATIDDGQGVGTITDDDPPVAISVDDVSVLEGNFGLVSATFTVSLSSASGRSVSVDYATANGSAIAPADYLAATGTLNFAAGETTKQVTVLVNGDLLDEVNETYFLNLTNAANATIADGQGLGMITNDDGPPSLSVNDVTVTEGDSGTTSATFTVTLAPASGQNVSVDYSTADGTATAPADYAATSGTLTFAPSQTTQTVTVPVAADMVDELDETFTVDLSNAINAAIADGTGLGTILDDDPLPALSINDVTVTEPDAGTTNATFTVSLNAPSAHAISVDYGTADGTATAPADYAAGSGSLTFAAGETSKQVTVLVNGDLLDEIDETYLVNLSGPVNATIADGQGVGTITDNDPLPSLSINDATVVEGNTGTVSATYTVTLNTVSSRSVTVDYATANGTAVAPADYQAASGTLTFAPGQTTRQLTVLVNGDQLDEIDENYSVNLTNPSNATIADGQGVGTIEDDDPLPAISVNDATVIEGDSGNENARFSVTLDAASGRAVSVDFATADGTAQAPGDYQARTGTLTFAPGETSKVVIVQVKGDVIDESNETYFFNLSNPANATILDGQGIGTIVDDDGLPSLSINDVTTGEGQSGTIPANFTVTLSSPSEQTVSVGFATADGSAHAPDDYVATGGNVVFSPGQITKTVTVQVRGDLLAEIDETYLVNLSGPVNATIDDGQGVGTITDDDAPPALSVNDVTTIEGNSGTVNATFIVGLSAPSGLNVSVDFATADGTATAPDDYTAANGTVSFTPGQTSKQVTVQVKGDLLDEANETYFVNLSNPSNATIADGQGLGTITDDDPLPALSVNDVTVTEGNFGTTQATYTVSLNAPSGRAVSVDFATADLTATAPADYLATSGTLDFAAGQTSKQVTVLVNGDLLDEADETYALNLTNAANATIADGQGLGTITDDDALPALSIDDVTVTEGNSGTVAATFTVSLTPTSGRAVTVDYTTANGTAQAPGDYQAATGSLTFAAGQSSRTVTVLVNGDTLDEDNETFFLNLSNPGNATISDGTGVGTIGDDDGLPALSINDVTVTEGQSGTTNAVFTVTLSAASGNVVTANYATADGTAIAPADYAATAGTVTFPVGVTTRTITVLVAGDLLDEINETYTLNLSNPTNATIADGTGLGTITDDDATPSLSINDVTVTEGNTGTVNATFIVGLTAPSGLNVSVDFATADGTATAPADYTAASGTLSFTPGQTSKQVTVQVKGDLLDEANETYFVNLSNPSNATIADGQGVGTITDDDPLPALSINDVSIAEGNTGTVAATYTVTLTTVSGRSVAVDYATANGTAMAPADYQAASGTLVFAPGQTTRQLTVLVNGDLLDEANETYFVNLSNPSNATIADGQGAGTITDDDAPPAISVNDATVTEGDSGTTNATFTVTLDAASGRAVSVDFATADGTAQAPGDYQARTGTLTFAPGETSKVVIVQVKGDVIDESNETYFFNLSNPANATILDGQGIGTIVDDDGLPSLSINDVTTGEGQSGTIPANFTVTLSSPSEQTVSVGFATADGSAHAPDDYVATGGNVVFSPGQITKTVTIQVRGDLLDEIDETYLVNLSGPVNAVIDDGQGLGTITDDDAPPALSVNDVAIAEGNTGDRDANFTVSLNVPSGRAVTVDFATANGTAQAPGDYQAGSGTLTFEPGESIIQVETLAVPVFGDSFFEGDETFFVNLTNPINATIADGEGLGTIMNDDAPPPPPPPVPPPPAPPPPPPPPPPAPRGPLYQPPTGSRLTQPPLLTWRSMKRARFYNVQLYRKGSKILSIWPGRARLKLHKRWRYNGRTFRLTRGSYTWLVWPAYGTRKKPNFGSRLGQSSFKIVAGR